MIIYHPVIQGSEEWLEIRKSLWTGSSSIRLLQEKPFKEETEWAGNKYTMRGHALEIAAIREYERKYRRTVARPGFVTNTVYTNAGYSPDGIDGGWLLEVKAFNGKRHEDLVAEKIPLVVLVQIYFGMVITGKRKARLLAFNPEYKQQLTVIEIPYDKRIGSNIRKKLRADMKNRLLNK
jgi:hypothetical protein